MPPNIQKVQLRVSLEATYMVLVLISYKAFPGKIMLVNTVTKLYNIYEIGYPGFNAMLSGNLSL